MSNQESNKPGKVAKKKLTTNINLSTYDAIIEIQRQYRWKKGRELGTGKILDAAMLDYAKRTGITVPKEQ